MKIDELSHPDSVWTYKSSARSGKVSVWLPYLQEVKKEKAKNTYLAVYRGGMLSLNLAKIDCVMIYGVAGSLPVDFLDALGQHRIPLIIHRRNLSNPYCFFPARRADEKDMLTRQVLCRENQIRRVYIARTLIRERIKSFAHIMPPQITMLSALARARSVAEVRNIEAQCSRRYWARYYAECGACGVSRRDKKHPINQALNACSVFLSGVILRWLLLHRLAPTHGFLHEPSGYPALVYDLMEPARYWLECATLRAVREADDEEKYIGYALQTLKTMMDDVIYIPATRQHVRRKSMAHGMVLALRAYLAGDMRRLVLPVEGERAAGRPLKVSYRLPGGVPQA